MVSLCTANRDESMQTDPGAAQRDAQALLAAGELRLGTDESEFNAVLCSRNYAQLQLIFQDTPNRGHDIEETIKREFSGNSESGFLAIVRAIKNQAAFFAKEIHSSLSGAGTEDSRLIRLVVTRCEVDMEDIKRAYESKYGESLKDAFKWRSYGISHTYLTDIDGTPLINLQIEIIPEFVDMTTSQCREIDFILKIKL
ncbi:unnamed protein product [Phaedon cochleariae]|uniref:Annexin n=1 Tax=Phaedon cochleariae TaxID=80249 RepID=A0A9N9SAD5_PHACE|nr:unnamed protein product [Phaedon cochleariae]